MDRRSTTRKTLFGKPYSQESCFVAKSKLQTGSFAIGRMLNLCRKEPGYNTLSKERAREVVAKEFIDDWIDKNVYPTALRTVSRQICADYVAFKDTRKVENRIDRPKSKNCGQTAESFHVRMTTTGYDIRSQNKD
ncbi:hypothetical protein SNE40_021984 [Patella caerulea]|uniref:Uncharacterized protein n=1 Tax=Patella caerulea TaxID=87958 RepID=A0AAN8G8Q3_PATCE